MKKQLSAAAFLILFLCSFSLNVRAGVAFPEHAEAKALVSLVREAAALVGEKGKGAFPELRQPNSKWNQGGIYIFVIDYKGIEVVNPANPKMEGTSVLGIKDEGGKLFVRDYVNLAKEHKNGEAWGHFQWHRPPSNEIQWKTAFVKQVKSPTGGYLVGSGLYNLKMEKMFVVDTVDNAVQLINQKGKAAFDIFNDKTSQFQYQDVYIFVIDEKGLQLAHQDPALVGRNVLDLQDKNGKPLVKDMIQMLKTQESGWMDYWWPKPGETKPSKKSSYLKRVKVDNTMLVVGAGVYLE